MPLDHAILAILTRGPLHGHALGKQLDLLLHGLWAVNPGQVYATLGRLARDGWIAPVEDAPSAGRVRVYALLPAGRGALRRWLERPLGCDERADPFARHLAILVAAGDGGRIARALDARHRRCAAWIALLERRSAAPGSPDDLLASAARRHLEAEVAWLAEARAALLTPPPGGGSARADMDSPRD